jgi:hypothetical protein
MSLRRSSTMVAVLGETVIIPFLIDKPRSLFISLVTGR